MPLRTSCNCVSSKSDLMALNIIPVFSSDECVRVIYRHNAGLNNFINWLLMFGLTSLSSVLIFFEFFHKKNNSNKILRYGILETFISSV